MFARRSSRFLAWHFCYEIGGDLGALFGTLFLCFEFTVMMHQRMILSEAIFLPMLMTAVGFGIRYPLRAAIFFGLLALIHPTGLIAALVFLGICLYKNRKASWLGAILMLSFPIAWVGRNYLVTGHPVYTTDGGLALLRCTGRYLDPGLDESKTLEPAKTTFKLMAKYPIRTIKYFALSAIHLLIGSGVDMLFVRPYTPHGLMALLKEYPLLWPVQFLICLELAAGYGLFVVGLIVLWNRGQKEQACFLGISVLMLLASGSVEGYYRWRIPLMPYLAIGIASCFSLLSPEVK